MPGRQRFCFSLKGDFEKETNIFSCASAHGAEFLLIIQEYDERLPSKRIIDLGFSKIKENEQEIKWNLQRRAADSYVSWDGFERIRIPCTDMNNTRDIGTGINIKSNKWTGRCLKIKVRLTFPFF